MRTVPSLAEIASDRTDLDSRAVSRLEALQRDLGLLADLAFSDLLLWLPVWNSGGYVAAAQVRPSTAATRYPHDMVGSFTPRGRRPELDRAWVAPGLGQVAPRVDLLLPAGAEAIGVGRTRSGPWIAALTRDSAPTTRANGTLERVYLQSADDLFAMIRVGDFPFEQGSDSISAQPRVGDGLIRLDANGKVEFASPNASSAYRRLGFGVDLIGVHLGSVSGRIARRAGAVDASFALGGTGRIAGEVELASESATITIRTVPLRVGDRPIGSLVLVRDVTEIRRRERALLSKEATIREIHHRVKNNLQTVAALLRLQGRRLGQQEAAAALADAERRVAAIAVVHDLLAHSGSDELVFDDVADRLMAMVRQTSTADLDARCFRRTGSFGISAGERATSLSMALVELLANAVEHGSGEVILNSSTDASGLHIEVSDEGSGFPVDFVLLDSPRLGLRIVDALIREEMRGVLSLGRTSGRTTVRIDLPLD